MHIPFCKRKCNYCDFISYAGKEDLIDEYVTSLCKELEQTIPIFDFRLSTIYIGGGTPTLLEPKHFDKIIRTLIGHWKLDIGNFEVSIESNPSTADKQKLKELRQLGINRLSIGVQSFNDDHLRTLGRIHDTRTALNFYNDARSAGFENINIDLIFALPGQTFSDWQSDLNQALHLKPNHISTYNLIIEPGTNFYHRYKNQSQEAELDMYEYTIETLTKHGFEHYEISNFCRPGQECQHNITYWKNENYIGIGAAAHSHINGQRWSNTNSIEEYIKNPPTPPSHHTGLTTPTHQQESIFMGLRLINGLAADKFTGFKKELNDQIKAGLLVRDNDHIKLTRKGLYLANVVMAEFV